MQPELALTTWRDRFLSPRLSFEFAAGKNDQIHCLQIIRCRIVWGLCRPSLNQLIFHSPA
jgi:hypothetical protein